METHDDKSVIKIYFEDKSYITIQISNSASIDEVNQQIKEKLKIDDDDSHLVLILRENSDTIEAVEFDKNESVFDKYTKYSVDENGRSISPKFSYIKKETPLYLKSYKSVYFKMNDSNEDPYSEVPILKGHVWKKADNSQSWEDVILSLYDNFLIYKKSGQFDHNILILANSTIYEDATTKSFTFNEKGREKSYTFKCDSIELLKQWVTMLTANRSESITHSFFDQFQSDIEDAEFKRADQDENHLLSVSTGLKGFLCHKSSFNFLISKLRSKHSEEILYFWSSVEDYKNLFNKFDGKIEEKWIAARNIYNDYLNHGVSQYELLIGTDLINKVKLFFDKNPENTSNPPPNDLFDDLQDFVYKYIEKGHYKQFVDSSDSSKVVRLTSLGISLTRS